MSNVYVNPPRTVTQADSPVVIQVPASATAHQFAISALTATAGTVAVSYKAAGSTVTVPLKAVNDAAVVCNIPAGTRQRVEGQLAEFTFTLAGLNGTIEIGLAGA